MSAQEDSIARVATNVSNRKSAKGKGKAIVVNPASAHLQSRHGDSEKTQSQRKVVYKSFLDTPFTVKWPNIPLNIQNTIFACLVDALSESGVANYHLDRERAGRERKKIVRREKRKEKERSNETGGKRKRTEEEEEEEGQDGRERKRRKDDSTLTQGPDRGSEGPPANLDVAPGDVDKTPKTEVPRPSILSHLTIGINEVTKRLEAQTRHWRTFRNRTTGVELDYGGPDGEEATAGTTPERAPLSLILICRSDVDPPTLIAHFPLLVAACNASIPPPSSTCKSDDTGTQRPAMKHVLLVELPKGSEYILAEAVGLRRVAVLGIDTDASTLLNHLTPLLQQIPPLIAPWLKPVYSNKEQRDIRLLPTHIKQVKTTAPKDMRAAKEERIKQRNDAKGKVEDGSAKRSVKRGKTVKRGKAVHGIES